MLRIFPAPAYAHGDNKITKGMVFTIMGKANRNKRADQEARQLAAQQKKQAQETAKKKALRNKIIGITALVLAVVLIGSTLTYNKMLSSGFFMRRTTAASTANFELDQTHASYFFNQLYSQYSQMASYLGIDTTQSLKNQANSMTGSGTWFDYFMTSAKSEMTTLLLFAEEAKARGIELDDADYDLIDKNIKDLKKAAKEAGVSTSYYIHALCGAGVSMSDVRDVLELSTLASKCQTEIVNAYKYTAEDYENYRKDHEKELLQIDYITMSITTSDATVASDSSLEVIADFAKKFENAKSRAQFEEIAFDYLRNHTYKDDKNMTDDAIREEIASLVVEGASYSEGSEFSEWAFESGRKANDTYTYSTDDGNAQYAYLLLSTPALDKDPTVNIRHILLSAAEYGSEEKAKAKAEEILAEWKAGTADAASFGELAAKYSEDSSAASGGLIENVAQGDMVENFDAWLFADGRKAGDSGIVQSEYGFHVMYMDGEGLPGWQVTADTALKNAKYQEEYAAIAAKFPITFNEGALNAING